jgi:glycosyltransferase involved in cell wall biosynthesis
MARTRALRQWPGGLGEDPIELTREPSKPFPEEGIRASRRTESGWPKIIATVPCYNEAPFVAEMVRQARRHVDQVIVVDDGSQDGTSSAAMAAGATIVRHGVNQGYGEAIRSCFQAARSNGTGIMVTIDGDNQHLPGEIETLTDPILKGEADLVIGSRLLQSSKQQTNMPRYRRLGIKTITWLFNVGSRAKVSDAQSGFRAYSREILDTIALTDRGMGVSVEVLIKARKMGFTIREVPISCRYDNQRSTLNPVSHGLGVALAVVKFRALSMCSRRGTPIKGKGRAGQEGQGATLGQCPGR